MVWLETQEFDNQFNLKPQTPHDLYFDKLKKANIKNMQIQSNEGNVDWEINTDDIDTKDTFNQFPEDVGTDYWKLRWDEDELGDAGSEHA